MLSTIPDSLQRSAAKLFRRTVRLRRHPITEGTPRAAEARKEARRLEDCLPLQLDNRIEPPDQAILRAYSQFCPGANGSTDLQQKSLWAFGFNARIVARSIELYLLSRARVPRPPKFMARLKKWMKAWWHFEQTFQGYETFVIPVGTQGADYLRPTKPMGPPKPTGQPEMFGVLPTRQPASEERKKEKELPPLSSDQKATVERLVSVHRSRLDASWALPVSLLPKWSHTLVIGPTGTGKTFAIQEAARQLGLTYGRWDIGTWNFGNSRSSPPTLEIINAFCEKNFGGLIHLSGLEYISPRRIGEAAHNQSYWTAVAADVQQFLDRSADRRNESGEARSTIKQPLVVLSGRFSTLWSGGDVDEPGGGNAWRAADREPLTEPAAILETLERENHLSTGLLARLTLPPLIVPTLSPEEAGRLGSQIAAMTGGLSPLMDGMEVSETEVAALLSGPEGWRGLTRLLESRLMGI